MTNLVGNALKFTERGAVHIALTTRAAGDRQRCLDAGMNGKPYRLDALRGVLQRWLPRPGVVRRSG